MSAFAVMRWFFPLLLVTSLAPAAADPPPTTLTMKRFEASNIHRANQRGAMNRRTDITVTVELGAKGRLAVISTGTDGDHSLVVQGTTSFNTDVETAWTTTWSGTWSTRGNTMKLSLSLDDHRCTKQRTSTGVAPETLACAAPSKRSELMCETEEIEVSIAASAAKPRKTPAWRCTRGTGELAETPSYWVLGKRSCIKTLTSRFTGDAFERC